MCGILCSSCDSDARVLLINTGEGGRAHVRAYEFSLGRYAFTHLEGNVVRFAPLYEKYNGGKAMSSHWMKNRNATIFEPPHKKRRGSVSQNYRDELQRRRAKKARRRANH